MKPWIKRTLFGIFGASLLVGGLAACGQRHHQFGANMSAQQYVEVRDKMVDRTASKLDLNTDQKKLLVVLGDKFYAQRTALMGQAKDPRAEVKALLAGDKFDKVRAQSLVTEKTTALQTGSPEVITALAEFYDSLNPTQQQKIRDFMDRRGRWFHRG
jgi:Spy/CpxP family protein refolding chaperone